MPQVHQQGCVDVITLDDRLTLVEAQAARDALADVLRRRLPRLIVDLRRVRVLDSAGLELLCDLRDFCLKRGGMLRLAATPPLARDVLRVTGLDEEFSLSNDVVSAAGEFVS